MLARSAQKGYDVWEQLGDFTATGFQAQRGVSPDDLVE